jgi:hypothetical protein
VRTPIWKTYIGLTADDGSEFEKVITDPPGRVLEVIVLDGEAVCTLRTVDEHENVSLPVASFDVDAQTLIGVLQAGLAASPLRDGRP